MHDTICIHRHDHSKNAYTFAAVVKMHVSNAIQSYAFLSRQGHHRLCHAEHGDVGAAVEIYTQAVQTRHSSRHDRCGCFRQRPEASLCIVVAVYTPRIRARCLSGTAGGCSCSSIACHLARRMCACFRMCGPKNFLSWSVYYNEYAFN